MKGRNLTLIVIVALILILGGCACSGYNRIIDKDVAVKTSWNNVQTEYQKRNDLVDQLVATVKGAANFERETLESVIQARAKATAVNVNAENLTPEKVQQFQQAQNEVGGALNRLLVTVERYPELKATQNFMELQRSLEGIENGIRNARNSFNAAVNDYNLQVRRFPNNIFAGVFGYREKEGFQADPGSQNAPKVQF
jgi:LemA protein